MRLKTCSFCEFAVEKYLIVVICINTDSLNPAFFLAKKIAVGVVIIVFIEKNLKLLNKFIFVKNPRVSWGLHLRKTTFLTDINFEHLLLWLHYLITN